MDANDGSIVSAQADHEDATSDVTPFVVYQGAPRLLLLAVAHQLLLVSWVERPRGATARNVFYTWHETVGVINLIWVYVIAHACVALLHQVQGHRVLQRMFGPRPG